MFNFFLISIFTFFQFFPKNVNSYDTDDDNENNNTIINQETGEREVN
jgi:hypothetical protein